MKVLLVVDVQNDFLTGTLANKDAQAVLPMIEQKINQCRAEGYLICFTRDTHSNNSAYLDSMEGRYLPCPHCIKGTTGWNIAKGLYKIEDYIIDKERFGCQYIVTEIQKALALPLGLGETIEEIELIGFCTDICVISNALILKASMDLNNTIISCDSSCCAGTSKEAHTAALTVMHSCQIEVY